MQAVKTLLQWYLPVLNWDRPVSSDLYNGCCCKLWAHYLSHHIALYLIHFHLSSFAILFSGHCRLFMLRCILSITGRCFHVFYQQRPVPLFRSQICRRRAVRSIRWCCWQRRHANRWILLRRSSRGYWLWCLWVWCVAGKAMSKTRQVCRSVKIFYLLFWNPSLLSRVTLFCFYPVPRHLLEPCSGTKRVL